MKFLIVLIVCLLASKGAYAQFTATSSIAAAQEDWDTAGAWSFPAGFTPNGGFPNNDFDEDASTAAFGGDYGRFIIIDTNDNIKIPNNVVIDLSNSGIETITLRAGSELHFGSNAQLILPAGAVVIFEAGAELIADSNSSGTYLEVGGNGVWGRECEPACDNGTLTGPGSITENSDPSNPLPVELSSFTTDLFGESVNLKWSTASQLNFSHFEIEHSMNAEAWSTLESIQGEGTTNELNEYSFKHTDPYNGKNYYRLRMVDLDETFEYSPIEFLEVVTKNSFVVSPNPSKAGIVRYKINFSPMEGDQLVVYDLMGGQIFSNSVSMLNNEFELPNSLAKGTYLVRYNGQTVNQVVRLIID
ncbi:T9SS type A sorting domain-containing protein [Chryseotalea sanaruensis]|nr:T9SS type A sorting domain-containing protein [Chryseotalea sanaruensis]